MDVFALECGRAACGKAVTGGDTRRIVLPAGTLTIAVESAAVPLDELCDFAVRNNARRGFLIVSKVLGRHVPTTPLAMQMSFDALAARLAGDLAGPVVFIGMAETAICLGQGVFAAWRARTRRTDSLYLHTTRQRIDAALLARFDEPHSHASLHLVYAPVQVAHRALLAAARTLVIVDDEASTGTTLINLAEALAPALPCLEAICTAVLADWSDGRDYAAQMPVTATAASLLKGRLTFAADAGFTAASSAPPAPVAALGRMLRHTNHGRLGIETWPGDIDAFLPDLGDGAPQRFLVLGTGEFVYPPYLLARRLESLGHDVMVQAITRSPIHIGGAIRSAVSLTDNYGTNVPNFLYNAMPGAGRRVLVCHETPAGSIDPDFMTQFSAECIGFGAPR